LSTLQGSEGYAVSKSHAVKYFHGSATLSDPSSDTIIANFTGSGKETGAGTVTFKFNGKLTGGTGGYAGAAGTLLDSGTDNLSTGAVSIKVSITLTHFCYEKI
jgi:hypothetical protein